MFEVTERARAEMAKRRKRARDEQGEDSGGTGAHAMADGAAQFHEDEKKRREDALKVNRHPESGRFVPDPQHPYLVDGHAADSPGNVPATPRPATSWPGTDAHAANVQSTQLTQVGDRRAVSPAPQTTISTVQTERVSGASFTPGTAAVQHVDLATGIPIRPSTLPVRPPFHTAPTNTGAE